MNIDKLKSIAVVICAGGVSKRFGVKKEYQKIDSDTTVLGMVVKTFSEINSIDTIAIAIPKDGENEARKALPQEFLNSIKPKLLFCEGGETRQASVYNALRSLEQFNPGFVLIHDGARPFISASLIKSVIEAAQKHGAAIPVLSLTDTPKEHDGKFITHHLKRVNTGIAQTPQGFKFAEILQAHEKAAELTGEEFTDDAEVWGKFCGDVAVVPGETANKKITFKEDLI